MSVRGIGIVYRFLLDLFFPPYCVMCGGVGTWLCQRCGAEIPFWEGPFCLRCGRPWSGPGVCSMCQGFSSHLTMIRSAFLFEGAVRDVIHALKYRGANELSEILSARMASYWQARCLVGDLLVPVPLHPERESRRGYNQAALLAQDLGRVLHLPVASRLLQRVRNTTSQTRLNRTERLQNVKDAFVIPDGVDLSGMKVTLVDDVVTTGATLNACAEVLLEAGAENVLAFTLARAA